MKPDRSPGPVLVEDQRPSPLEALLRVMSNVATGGAPARPGWMDRYAVESDAIARTERESANRQAWLKRNLPDGSTMVVNPVLGTRRVFGAPGPLVVRPTPDWMR